MPDSAPELSMGVPLFFVIPLKAKAVSDDWDLVCRNLERTVENLSAQSDPGFRIIVVCHDVPPFLALPRCGVDVVVLIDAPIPQDMNIGTVKDKTRKRRAAGVYLKAKGVQVCYFMQVDADDLVHKDLVQYVHATDNKKGYIIKNGYLIDEGNALISRCTNFDQHCGTCAVFYLTADDLPSTTSDQSAFLWHLKDHTKFIDVARDAGRTLDPIDFYAALYMINHGENDQRYKGRNERKVYLVQRASFGGLPEICALAKEFPGLHVSGHL